MVTTLETFDTEFSADSIEWRPNSDVFVCGTYQLQEHEDESAKSTRVGRIYLFCYASRQLKMLQQLETNAVLDQRWNDSLLAVADSKGFVSIYQHDMLLTLQSQFQIDAADDELLALSLDWSTKNETKIVVSDSKGNFSVLAVSATNMEKTMTTKAHEFEAWIAIFDKHRSNIVYTGGDDTFLNCFDLRLDSSKPCWKNKSHSAGVTTLLSTSDAENLLITGSYDERLHLFDIRQPKSSITEINLGGGIWRIKQHPKFSNLLLTANMYHNFAVVDFTETKFNVIAEYFEHKSICYGADWCPMEKTFATCSFYDHKMSIATIESELI